MSELHRICETDNHGSDYPNEKFVNLPPTTKENAERIAEVINSVFCPDNDSSRFWKVVKADYKLQLGFEP